VQVQSRLIAPVAAVRGGQHRRCRGALSLRIRSSSRLARMGLTVLQHTTGALAQMYSLSLVGLAAFEQLNTAESERTFRTALQLAPSSAGENAYSATLASAALGDLLYERGQISEAEQLLDEWAKLGFAGGPVEFCLQTMGRARVSRRCSATATRQRILCQKASG
jgi:hypothetical protein